MQPTSRRWCKSQWRIESEMMLEMLNPVWQCYASVRQDVYGEAGPVHETHGSIFSKLHSSHWPNDQPCVNQFVVLRDVETYHS